MRSWQSLKATLAPSRANLAAGIAGLAIGTMAGFSLILWAGRTNPVMIYSAREIDGVAHRGGHIDIEFSIDRVRTCPAETSRWIWTWVDLGGVRIRQYFPLANSNAELTEPGDNQHFILSLQLPAYIWPGEWFYLSKTIEHCPTFPTLFNARIFQTPEIPFRIVESP